MTYGSVSFAVVSVVAYSIWAFRLVPGTIGLYSTTATVYLVLSGLVLSRLVIQRELRKRFPLWFAAAFLVYAVGWCAFWFGLNGKYHADLWGAAAGLAGMTWVLQRAFHCRRNFLPLFGVLFACHSLGYTLGYDLYTLVSGTSGRLLWGTAHGLGFGAGLGYLILHAQRASEIPVTFAPVGASSGH